MSSVRALAVWLLLFTNIATSLAKNTPKDEAYISFSYEQELLAEVIDDLQNRYDLAFSYSPTKKLMEQLITARSGLVVISEALDILFAGTPIEYRVINGRIAMRYSSRLAEEILLTSIEAVPEKEPEPEKARRPSRKVNTIFGRKRDEPEEIATVVVDTQLVKPVRTVVPAAPEIPREEAGEIPWQSSPVGAGEKQVSTVKAKTRRLARVSILPGLSSSSGKSSNTVHSISFNLPAGLSGGLVGAELGILFNGITGDMEGAQISGGLNVVNGQMTGVQVGLFGNGAGIGTGIQVGGIFNYCHRTLEGTQISSLLNVGLNGVNSQISAGLNIVQGTVNRQIGLVNRAVDVRKGQIGLVNVADTVAGRSFGLVNFVRKGYNNLETARSSVTPYASTLKLGSHRLYNVFELGWGRRDLLIADEPENEDPRKTLTWSFGYGFGWTNRLGNSTGWRTNTEFVVAHLNRGANWIDRLNLVGSIRYTFDIRGGKVNHYFFGPVLNLHFTQLSERELDGLFVSGWKLWSQQYDTVKFRGVLGIRFGFRIGRH
ncbi:hypothetical protein CEQ90_12420 [Lewinellaceae bacterium SD302]|nr:hypothetical protein CEQ90_12420 [Lewinellaceae bacterium SD302]